MFNILLLNDFWAARSVRGQRLFLVLAGAVAGLGQAPFDWPVFTLLGLGFGLWAGQKQGGTGAFGAGWALGLGYFLVTLHWIMEPFWVDAATTGILAVPALLALSAGLAVLWGIGFRLGLRWGGLGLCLGLALAELTRSYLFTGFPWALVGYVWIDTPVYQLAAFIGPHGMTTLTVVGSWLVFYRRARLGVGMLLVAGIAMLVPLPDPAPLPPDAPTVRLVHPNVLQRDKWHPDKREGIYQNQLAATAEQPPVDLIIWPESSVYLPLDIAASEIAAMSQDAPVVVGHQRIDDARLYYNSMSVVLSDGRVSATYDKYRLVPFGEYIPLGAFAERLGLRGLAATSGAGFARGAGPAIMDIPGIGSIQPLICYEGIFPQLVGATDKRPDVLILITNDGWFGTFAGPAQHYAQSRARAIELGLPLIRVANRGVSTVLDARGNSLARLGVTDKGVIDVQMPGALPETIYSQYRDAPLIFLLLILMYSAAMIRRGNKG